MLEETGCDAIMIGRGVLGNPWLIKETVEYLDTEKKTERPSDIEKIDMCIKHLEYLQSLKNEKVACLEIRNHIAWYFKGMKNASEIKNKVYKTSTIHDIMQVLMAYKEELIDEGQ